MDMVGSKLIMGFILTKMRQASFIFLDFFIFFRIQCSKLSSQLGKIKNSKSLQMNPNRCKMRNLLNLTLSNLRELIQLAKNLYPLNQ